MDENVKKILEEYSKEDMYMFFEQMKKESSNHHNINLGKSHYCDLSKRNLKELSKNQLIRIIYSLQKEVCFQNMIMLEKALDKACEQLENLSYVTGLGQVGRNFKEWKEWLLEDE